MYHRTRTLLAALLVVGLLFTATPVAAQSSADDFATLWNDNIDRVPGTVKGQFAEKNIYLYLTDTDRHFSVRTTADGRIISQTESDSRPSGCHDIAVRTSESTIERIVTADDRAAAYEEARRSGAVTLAGGYGCGFLGDTWNGFKYGIIDFLEKNT